MPTLAATVRAVSALSPVSIITSMPAAFSLLTASADVGRIRSASAMTPSARPSRPTPTTVLPARCRGVTSSSGSVMPCSARNATEPSAAVWPRSMAVTPLPATDANCCTLSGAHAFGIGRRHDRQGERVQGSLLQARCDTQDIGTRRRSQRQHAGHHGAAFGQGSRLVDDQHVEPPRFFERACIPDQQTELRAASGADHDRGRRRQAERTRACDHENRHGIDERRHRTRSVPPGDCKGGCGNGHDHGNEHACDAIGQPLNRRLRTLHLGDQANDARQQRRAADTGSFST